MRNVSLTQCLGIAVACCLLHSGCSADDEMSGWSFDTDGTSRDVSATAPTLSDSNRGEAGATVDEKFRADVDLGNLGEDAREDVNGPIPRFEGIPDIGKCSGEATVTTFTLSGPPPFLPSAFAPRIANGAIYFHKEVDGIPQIFAQKAGSGVSRQLTDRDLGVWLEEAAGEYFVAHTRVSETNGRNLLQIRKSNGAVLGEILHLAVQGVQESSTSGEALRTFDGSRLLTAGPDTVYFDKYGRELGRIDWTPRHVAQGEPLLTESGAVVYAAAQLTSEPPNSVEAAPADVFLWTPDHGAGRLTNTSAGEGFAWSDDSDLYWKSPDGVFVKQGTNEPRKIYNARCGPPHAANGLAAFACARDDATVELADDETLPVTTELFLFASDDRHPQRIPLGDTSAMLHSVRVGPHGVAWMEFTAPDSLCQGGDNGRVMYFDFATGQKLRLGEVIAPCWCCNIRNMSLSFDLEKHIVAWSNAGPLKDARFEPLLDQHIGGFAYATVEPPSGCETP